MEGLTALNEAKDPQAKKDEKKTTKKTENDKKDDVENTGVRKLRADYLKAKKERRQEYEAAEKKLTDELLRLNEKILSSKLK